MADSASPNSTPKNIPSPNDTLSLQSLIKTRASDDTEKSAAEDMGREDGDLDGLLTEDKEEDSSK